MKITYLLDSIDMGNVVLPEFQRGYVWSRDQVKGLFQSLYQQFPVGGLLIWETTADATTLRGSEVPGSKTVKLLLDGQQRVTSLYGVMRGKPPEFFEDPQKSQSFTGLYFNIEDEVFEFYKPSTMANDPLWVSVSDLFVEGPATTGAPLQHMDEDAWTYMERLQRLYGIRDKALHAESLSDESLSVDVVVDIFNRVNSGGTKLSKGDLALARICAIRDSAREELRSALARWSTAGFSFSLDWLLRCINVVVTGEARFEALRSVSSEDFGLGLKNTEKAIDFVLNLLATRLGIDHNRVLLGRYGLPIMVRFVAENGGTLTASATQNRLLYWYIHQAMWGRFSGSTESMLDQDLAALEDGGLHGLIHKIELSRGTMEVRAEDFDTHTIGSRFYAILYMLTRISDSHDLCSGLSLSSHLLGKNTNLELHHIFPKALLYQHEEGYERQAVNAVANFSFLTSSCNKSLGMRPPEEYFEEVEMNHPGALISHWITDDRSLWPTGRYLDFLADRRARLATATNEMLAGFKQDQVVGDVVGSGGAVDGETDAIAALGQWCAELGLARPDTSGEVVDEASGEPLVYPDAVWPEGMQTGKSEKVALILEPDEESEARLGQLGFRFFTTIAGLHLYVEELLNIDLDGDGTIGPVDSGDEAETDGNSDPAEGQRAKNLRRAILADVWDRIGTELIGQGWKARLEGAHGYIELLVPDGHPLSSYGYHVLRCAPTSFTFRQVVANLPSRSASAAVVRALREQYGTEIERQAPGGTRFEWEQLNPKNALWVAHHPMGGANDIEASEAAAWAATIAGAWLHLLRTDPPVGVVESAIS